MQGHTAIQCPKCRKDDMIQKVSAVFSGGISTGAFAGPSAGLSAPLGSGKPSLMGGYSALSGSTQTALSRKLAPPTKPEFKSPRDPQLVGPYLCVFLLDITLLCIGLTNSDNTALFLVTLVVALGITLAFSALALKRHNVLARQGMARFNTDILPRWQSAHDIWNRAYYCARDDCVFDPSSGKSAPAESMDSLLYPSE